MMSGALFHFFLFQNGSVQSFFFYRKSKKYLENLCKDSDALEFRADLISLDDASGENVRSYDARHHLQHQLALLRRMSRDHAVRYF